MPNTIGLLWLDDSPKRELIDKVRGAIARYTKKFGAQPALCYMNTAQFARLDIFVVDGVRLTSKREVAPDNFLVVE